MGLYVELMRRLPDLAVRNVPPARVVEGVFVPRVTAKEKRRATAFSWLSLVPCRLPGFM